MRHFFRTAVYVKNLPTAERMLRVVAALGMAAAAVYWAHSPWLMWLGIGSAVTLVMTGLVGFCPACYLAGRKLARQAP